MSLILDALKKLEREKDAQEPGVLVVGSVPWGGGGRSRRRRALVLGAATVVGLVAAGVWRLRPAAPPDRAAPAEAPAPDPAPRPTTVPRPTAPSARATAPPARRLAVPAPVPVADPEVPSAGVPSAEPPAVSRPAPRATPDELRLNAISQRDGRPVALINDRLMFEGDAFDGVTVLRIGETEVELEVRGKRRVLRF